MTKSDRAIQFAPFAALKGYYELILAQEELREPREELCEDDAAELSARIMHIEKGVHVHVTFYDRHRYLSFSGVVEKTDFEQRYMVVDGKRIWFRDIAKLEEYEPTGRQTWL